MFSPISAEGRNFRPRGIVTRYMLLVIPVYGSTAVDP